MHLGGGGLDNDDAECALRILSGKHAGLTTKWRHGVARISPGRIVFRPGLWQLRVARPRTPPIDLDVQFVSTAVDDPRWRDAWSVLPTHPRAVVSTPTAELAWVVAPKHFDRAFALVQRQR
jgi:hypothetical protein